MLIFFSLTEMLRFLKIVNKTSFLKSAVGITFRLPEVPKPEKGFNFYESSSLGTSGIQKVIPKSDLIKNYTYLLF